MVTLGKEPGQAQCVVSMLDRLDEAATAFEKGRPLGPYLLDALLEDVELCPALHGSPDPSAHDQLHEAVRKATRSVQVVVACPSADRDWAVKELRDAVTWARHCLDEWRKSVAAGASRPGDGTVREELLRIGATRCPSCAFADESLRESFLNHD